jgi:hypothetical protein
LVDGNKYTRVSKSKSLCGKTGKDYWIPDAAYFYGANWKICAKCEKTKQNLARKAAGQQGLVE